MFEPSYGGLGEGPQGNPGALAELAQLFAQIAVLLETSAQQVGQRTRALTSGGAWSGWSATIFAAEGVAMAAAVDGSARAYADAAMVVGQLAERIAEAQNEARAAESLYQQEQASARANPLAATSPTWYFPARAQHDAARAKAEQAALEAAGRLQEIAGRAKPKPERKHKPKKLSRWEKAKRLWHGTTHVAGEVAEGAWQADMFVLKAENRIITRPDRVLVGAAKSIYGVGEFGYQVSFHPIRTAKGLKMAAQLAREHPGQFMKAVVNYDLLKKDPAEWAGSLLPDILLAVFTAGTGEVAVAGIRSAEGAELTTEAARNAQRASRAGRAAEHAQKAGRISLRTYELASKVTNPVEWLGFAVSSPATRRALEETAAMRQRVIRAIKEGPESHYLQPKDVAPLRTWAPHPKPYAIGRSGALEAAAGAGQQIVHERSWGFRPGLRSSTIANEFPSWKGDFPPYMDRTWVVDRVVREPETYVRVFRGEGGAEGGWLLKAKDIEGLTPVEIQQRFALPKVPDHIVGVELKEGTRVREGVAGPQPQWGNAPGGGIQIQLMDARAPANWGKPMRIPAKLTPALVAKTLATSLQSGANLLRVGSQEEA